MIFAHRCGSFRAHPFAIAAGVCLVLLIVASCVVFKQRRPELFAKALGAAEEKLRTALVDAGRKEIDLATEGKDIAKRLAEANVVAVATDGPGGVVNSMPAVTDDGDLVYVFEDLQLSAVGALEAAGLAAWGYLLR